MRAVSLEEHPTFPLSLSEIAMNPGWGLDTRTDLP